MFYFDHAQVNYNISWESPEPERKGSGETGAPGGIAATDHAAVVRPGARAPALGPLQGVKGQAAGIDVDRRVDDHRRPERAAAEDDRRHHRADDPGLDRGTTEKYFEATRSRFLAGKGAEAAALLQDEATQAAMGFLLFDQAREELARALGSNLEPGTLSTLLAVRGILRLSKGEAKRLQKELVALVKRVSEPGEGGASSRTKRRRYTLTIALLPADRDGGKA
jgi:hypothetical protein